MNYTITQKRLLTDALGKFLAHFGVVLPRKPYRDDDSGEGGAGLNIKTHPLFVDQPEGASSDLIAVASENKTARDEAEARINKLDPELRKKLEMQLLNEQKYQSKPHSAPTLRG